MVDVIPVPPVDFQLVRLNSLTSRVSVLTVDDDGVPVEPTSITVTISNGDDDSAIYTSSDVQPTTGARIVNTDTGAYYIVLGTISTDADEETDGSYSTLFVTWTVDFGATSGVIEKTVSVEIIPVASFRLISQLRMLVDKAIMPIDTDPLNPMYTGFTDAMLYQHLNHGLSVINWYGPPVTWARLSDFPGEHFGVLLEASVYPALMSQTMFAIATELDSYSDLGGSWMVTRSPKLQAMLQFIVSRLDIQIPKLKKLFYTPGGVYRQVSHRGSVVSLAMPGANGVNFLNVWGGVV